MNIILAAMFKMALSVLIVIQIDTDGELLVNGHVSLAFVAIALLLWAVAPLIYDLGRSQVTVHSPR